MPTIRRYGLGGALLTMGKNFASGKGLGSGLFQGVGQAAITPGSGVTAGIGLAKQVGQNVLNPNVNAFGQPVQSNINQTQQIDPAAAYMQPAIPQNVVGQSYGGRVGLIKAEGGVGIPGGPREFQAGQMVREGRNPAEEALTREMFAQQRLGMSGIPVAPTTKEGGLYESDPVLRDRIIEMRGRGHTLQGPSAQTEMDLMKYEEDMAKLNKGYEDYYSRRTPIEPKGPGYSFEEGPGGEGGTLKVTNAQRQSNGGVVYAQRGTNIPEDPKAAGAPDNRSLAQRLADELSQIYAGVENVVDRRGTEFSPRTDSIVDLFTRGYGAQERADAAREESGASGRVDAALSGLGAADRALSGPAPTKIGGDEWGGPSNPFSAMSRAYNRARMTDEARNASRQFAGGKVRLRKFR